MHAIEEFGLLLKAAAREAERQINDLLRPLGITAAQAEALEVIAAREPVSLAELGGLLVAEGGHPSRLVDRMVAADLVERRAAADDRRRVQLTVTPRGRDLGERAKQVKRRYGAGIEAKLAEVDLGAARMALEALLRGTPLGAIVVERRRPP